MPRTLPETKHFQLAQKLRRRIRRMAPGDAIPTVASLREDFGVSQATVERALNQLRKERLIWRPPGQMRLVVEQCREQGVRRISIIQPDYPSPTFDALCRTISAAGHRRHWTFDRVSYHSMEGIDIRRAVDESDGAVLLPDSEPFPRRLLSALRAPRRPVIVIQDPPPGLRVSSVRMDDEAVGRIAVEHLASLGHRRIMAFISEPPSPSCRARIAGWQQAMIDLGETEPELSVLDASVKPGHSSLAESYDVFSRWLDTVRVPFTAVFCSAWSGAVSAMRALREHGLKIPDDVSVVAHGGEEGLGPFLQPPLTTIEANIGAYGEEVIAALERHFTRPKEGPWHLVLPCALIKRASTGPARARPATRKRR